MYDEDCPCHEHGIDEKSQYCPYCGEENPEYDPGAWKQEAYERELEREYDKTYRSVR